MAEPIRVSKGGTYVPDWGNQDRVDGEKIVVHYRFLSFAEQQELLTRNDVRSGSYSYENKVVAASIHKIENLEVEDEDGRRAITTGDELVKEPGLDRLALELWLELRDKSAIDKKK